MEEVKGFVGKGVKIMLERALRASGDYSEARLEALRPVFADYYAAHLTDHSRPYPGAIAALEAIKASGAQVALCTNKSEQFTLPLLRQLGLAEHFSAIVCGDTLGQGVLKPDPAPVQAMVERAGGGRAVFIGDTSHDVEAARAAGLACIAVRFGFVDAADRSAPTRSSMAMPTCCRCWRAGRPEQTPLFPTPSVSSEVEIRRAPISTSLDTRGLDRVRAPRPLAASFPHHLSSACHRHSPSPPPVICFRTSPMARTDRSIGILLLSGLLAAIAVFWLTRSWEATAISALAGLLATALLYDAVERRIAFAITRPPAPAAGGASSDELATLLEALPHPCLIVHRGRVERCNHAALDLLGAHITGQDVRLALRQPAAIDLLAAPGGAREPARIAIAGLGTAEQSWELDIQPLEKGRNLVLLLLDQSGRQATEQMRVDFVANASHELRTPLAGILASSKPCAIPSPGGDQATATAFLAIMDGEARRMQRLVDDLMSLSRIEAE